MPFNQAKWITHTFNGGWATDFGNTLYVTPEQDQIQIPWFNNLENVTFGKDGSIGQLPGFDKLADAPLIQPRLDSTLAEQTIVYGLYEYTRNGTSLSGTTQLLAAVGSAIFKVTSTSRTYLGALENTLSPVSFSQFNDLVIISDGSTPKSYDQTTFQSLAGSPPDFLFSTPHRGRQFAAGISSNPSRLYYSVSGNPEDWAGAGSGSIDIDPGDGDSIVGLLSWKSELWVFKGPTKLSIHRITGSSSSDFARVPFIYGVSAVNHNSIFPCGDDFGFWSPRGSCHSLNNTSNYGDYNEAYINYPILSWCTNSNNLNTTYGNYWQSVTDKSTGVTYSLVNNYFNNSGRPFIIAMDWNFKSQENPYPRFSKITLDYFSSIALSKSVSTSNKLSLVCGTYDGFIQRQREYRELACLYNDTSIVSKIHPPYMTYGPPIYRKSIQGIGIEFVSNKQNYANAATASLAVGGPGIPTQVVSVTPSMGTVLDSFTLDTTPLGPYGNGSIYREYVSGETTLLQYELTLQSNNSNNNASEARIHHFGVGVIHSGSSMEGY